MSSDLLNYSLGFPQDLVVPKTENRKSSTANSFVSLFVVGLSFSMLSSVEFYCQSLFEACKVHDIGADRVLASKFTVSELPLTKVLPEMAFGIGGVAAQCPCAGGLQVWHGDLP
jgi:hypothetical protein